MTRDNCIGLMAQWLYSRMPVKEATYEAANAWAEELYKIAEQYFNQSKGSE